MNKYSAFAKNLVEAFRDMFTPIKHLAAGSKEPPRVDGIMRVYSMIYCPYAKRTRLILKAKNLPHDIVNINLHNKPEWYFKIHPKGQVPALLDGEKIVIESLEIADYLDEKYPTESPLYPKDANAKKRDQDIIRRLIGEVTDNLSNFLKTKGTSTPEQALEILLPPVQSLEEELTERKSLFFSGDKPGMVDLMLWPWVELVPMISAKTGVDKLPLNEDQIPNLRKWVKAMCEVPLIKELFVSPQVVKEIMEARNTNFKSFDYDAITKKIPANAKL